MRWITRTRWRQGCTCLDILAIIRRKLPEDWNARDNLTPVLCESFVETPRFSGITYKVSGRIQVETTQGRGRYDTRKGLGKPIKAIWLCPLRKDSKRTLNKRKSLHRRTFTASDILQVRTASPFPDLVDVFSEFHVSALDGSGLPTLGTGGWKVVEYEPGVRVRLTPASGTGKRVDFLSIGSAEGRLTSLQDGTVDCAMQLEKLSVPHRSLDGFNWVESDGYLSVIAFMNGRSGPFASPEARLAANLAIDRDALVSGVMGGLASPATTVVSPFHLGFRESGAKPIARDPAHARRVLLDSGVPTEIVLRSPEYMPERAPEIARFIAEALGEIGFQVDVQIEPDRAKYARQLGRKEMGDLAIFDSSPRSTFRVLDDKISSETASVWWQGVDDPRANDLFNSARRILDPGMRKQAYGECLAHLGRHPHWLYLFHPKVCMAHATELKGLSLDHSGSIQVF